MGGDVRRRMAGTLRESDVDDEFRVSVPEVRIRASPSSKRDHWTLRAERLFGNVRDAGKPSTERLSLGPGNSDEIYTKSVAYSGLTPENITQRRYFWTQRVSTFWLAHKTAYFALQAAIGAGILFGWIGIAFEPTSRIAPTVLAMATTSAACASIVPFWPKLYRPFTHLTSITNTKRSAGALSLATSAFIFAIILYAPASFVDIWMDSTAPEARSGASGTTWSRTLDPYGAAVSEFSALSMICVPCAFILCVDTWDFFSGLSPAYPVNPAFAYLDEPKPTVKFQHMLDYLYAASRQNIGDSERMYQFARDHRKLWST